MAEVMGMITGKTKNLGVMGWPIAHSLSPGMQQAAIAAAGADYSYIAMPVRPERLAEAVAGLRAVEFCGWNVTIPHKQAIMALLDEIDGDAQAIGAVNTVVNADGHLKGFNTDVTGFLLPLKERGLELAGREAAVLGAGGAARAVLYGLLKSGMRKIHVGVRNPAKAQALADSLAAYGKILVYEWNSEDFKTVIPVVSLLVNTTPLGMAPKVEEAPPVDWGRVRQGTFVYDIIYTPAETRFLAEARAHGCLTQNGERMLAGQGAEAFRLWTGIKADVGCMCEALRMALTKG